MKLSPPQKIRPGGSGRWWHPRAATQKSQVTTILKLMQRQVLHRN
jgi:hypothetical protein